MVYKVFDDDKLIAEIKVDGKLVTFVNYTEDILKKPFGVKKEVNIADFDNFVKSRCLPKNRHNVGKFLDKIDLGVFRPIDIIKVTNGFMAEDHIWILHEGEKKSWKDVKEFNESL